MPKSVNTPLQFWLSRILALEGREGGEEGGRKGGRERRREGGKEGE